MRPTPASAHCSPDDPWAHDHAAASTAVSWRACLLEGFLSCVSSHTCSGCLTVWGHRLQRWMATNACTLQMLCCNIQSPLTPRPCENPGHSATAVCSMPNTGTSTSGLHCVTMRATAWWVLHDRHSTQTSWSNLLLGAGVLWHEML